MAGQYPLCNMPILKKCKNCGKEFKAFTTVANLCYECSILKIADKLKDKKNPVFKKTKLPKKIKAKTYKQLIEIADMWASKYVRLRDGYVCFAKEIPEERKICTSVMQNNHLIKRGRHSTRFLENNMFCGCSAHNKKHNNYPEVMTNWFIRKFGADEYNELVDISFNQSKYTRQDLIEIAERYKKLYDDLVIERELQN